MKRSIDTRAAVFLLFGFLLTLIIVAVLQSAGSAGSPAPIVDHNQWKVSGQFSRLDADVDSLEVPSELSDSDQFVRWRSWTPETNGTVGTVSTVPFLPAPYMAIPYAGFPAEQLGNRIYFRCDGENRELDLATQRTNDQWATAYIHLPSSFCSGAVRLVATSVTPDFYIGIGTPFSISRVSYHMQTSFGPRALVVLGTWVLFASGIVLGGFSATRSYLASIILGFVVVAASGMSVLAAFMVSPMMGKTVAAGFVAALVARGLYLISVRTKELRDFLQAFLVPALLWLSISLAYAALVSAGDSGGGSWAINNFFSPLRWSSDNQLPFRFAESLFKGAGLEGYRWGPWLASDRTPLLSGLLLLTRVAIVSPFSALYGSTFISTAYMMAGITILTSWAAICLLAFRTMDAVSPRFMLVLAATAPLFVFNSVYTWGKLLGASYVLLAFVVLNALSQNRDFGPRSLTLVSCCASAAYLAHASNALVLIPLAIFYSATIARQGARSIAIASISAIALATPWLYWQAIVQPGGDVLMRFALTGKIDFNARGMPMMRALVVNMLELGPAGWLDLKLTALRQLIGFSRDWESYGEVSKFSTGADLLGRARVYDFFEVSRSIGVSTIGLLILPAVLLRQDVSTGSIMARDAAIVGLGALLFTIACTFPEAFTHHQAYGAILLVFVAGAWSISNLGWLTSILVSTSILYCFIVWVLHPLYLSLRFDPLTFSVFIVASVLYGILLQVDRGPKSGKKHS